MDISVVIPLYNEAESLPELHAWIKRVMDANHFSYEIIFVNDGSTDRSWNVIEELGKSNPEVKGMWSLPWMPTCKTVPTKFRNCIG